MIHDDISAQHFNAQRIVAAIRGALMTWLKVLVGMALLSGADAIEATNNQLNCSVEGEIVSSDFSMEGTFIREEKQSFRVWLQDDLWFIRISPAKSLRDLSYIDYTDIGTDGLDLYRLSVFNPNFDADAATKVALKNLDELITRVRGNGEDPTQYEAQKRHFIKFPIKKPDLQRSQNQALTVARPQPFVQYEYNEASAVVWLAYCSRSYLNENRTGKLPQVWRYDVYNQSGITNILPAILTRSVGFPYLPQQVVYANDGAEYELTNGVSLIRRRLLPPFENGYTNALYQVITFTNINGITLPTEFIIDSFRRRPGARKSSDLWINTRQQGKLSLVIFPCGRTNFLPVSPVPTLVDDFRSGRGRLQYLSPRGQMLTTTNQDKLIAFERDIHMDLAATRKKKRTIFAILVGACFILGFWFFFAIGRVGAKGKTDKQQ